MWKKILFLVVVLVLLVPSSHIAAQTLIWEADQPIEDNVNDGWNPQIAISGDKVVAVWQQYNGANYRIYSNFSADGGANWEGDRFIENNESDGMGSQVVASGNNVVAVWRQLYETHWRIYSNSSADGGVNWGADQLIEDNVNDGRDPQVAISGNNAVAVWRQLYETHWRIYSNSSADGGVNWGADQLIENNVGNIGRYPQVAISGNNVVAVWQQRDGIDDNIYSNFSTDGGANWGADQLIEYNIGNGRYPQVAIYKDKVVAVWQQRDGNYWRIYSNFSADGGANWGAARLIEDNMNNAWDPQVAISEDRVVAVWRQRDGDHERIYSNFSADGGVNWGTDQPIEDKENVGWDPQVTIFEDRVVAVWRQRDGDYNRRIYSNFSTDGGVSWAAAQLIEDNVGNHGGNPQVAISENRVVAVWWQNDGANSRIYSNHASFQASPTEGLCFIATAAYGTPMAEEIDVLSRLRDRYLLTNELGQRFVALYELHSPQWAEFISESEWAKKAVRIALWPLVRMAEFIVD